jgi:hypothetical protein
MATCSEEQAETGFFGNKRETLLFGHIGDRRAPAQSSFRNWYGKRREGFTCITLILKQLGRICNYFRTNL